MGQVGLVLRLMFVLASCSLPGYSAPKILTVTPGSVPFGSQIVDTTSVVHVLALTNVTDREVGLVSVVASGTFAQTNNCPIVPRKLESGAGCNINVTFSPAAAGAATGTIIITSGSLTSPLVANLSGLGILLTSIAVTPTNISIKVGQTVQLAATGTFSDGSTQDLTRAVTWTSSNASVATVSNAPGMQGLVTGVGIGPVFFTASGTAFDGGGPVTGKGGQGPVVPAVPRFAYAVNQDDNTVSLYTVDALTGQLRDNGYVVVQAFPDSIAVDPFNKFAYVVNFSDSSVSPFAINASTGALTPISSPVSVGNEPTSMAVDPLLGQYLYVVNNLDNDVAVFTIDSNTGNLSPTATFPAGESPVAIAIDPLGKFAYVTNDVVNTVSAYTINRTTGGLTLVATYSVGTTPSVLGLIVDSAGRFVYVANRADGTVSGFTIDSTTGALTPVSGSPFLTGALPEGLAEDASGNFLFVANSGSNTVTTFNIDRSAGGLSQVFTMPTPGIEPASVAVDPSNQFVYVADSGSNDMAAYSLLGAGILSFLGETRTRQTPSPIVLASGLGPVHYTPTFAYVANAASSDIAAFAIDPRTAVLTSLGPNLVLGDCSVDCEPQEVTIDPSGRFVYDGVSTFAISPAAGTLTLLGIDVSCQRSGVCPSGINFVTVDPSGRFVYTLFNSVDGGGVVSHLIDPTTGLLTSQGTTALPAGFGPNSVAVDPTGRFAYTANSSSDVSAFQIDPTNGGLTSLGPNVPTGSGPPLSVAIDPSGRFLYTVNLHTNDVSAFAIDPKSGTLTSLGRAVAANGLTPFSLSVDPTGRFLYIANTGSDDVSAFAIDPVTGALTLLGPNVSVAPGLFMLTIDPSGRFVYTVNVNGEGTTNPSTNVSGFAIDPFTGRLTSLGLSVMAGFGCEFDPCSFGAAIATTGAIK